MRDIGTDPDDQATRPPPSQMAHSLGMSTIAEGVETTEQLILAKGRDQAGALPLEGHLLPEHLETLVRANLQAHRG